MLVDGALPTDLATIAEEAAAMERVGFDGLFTIETAHDPFLPLLLAAEHTERPQLITSIAVAFARNPMTLAQVGYDLQAAAGGRFVLGLGSQIKPHIEKRFSMPWSHPAARMREMVLAIRAIWTTWQTRKPLNFRGEFYRHTLMTPMFDPGPNPFGYADIWLAGVGPRMTETAGEVADGFFIHPFSTPEYVRRVTLPALERGFARSGRKRREFTISWPVFTITGTTDAEVEANAAAVRKQIAFYASTPAYKPVLDQIGYGDLSAELTQLSKRGQWDQMARLITPDLVDAFAVQASPEDVPRVCRERFGALVDRVSFTPNYRQDPARWSRVLSEFRG